jgi:hypothetical protein
MAQSVAAGMLKKTSFKPRLAECALQDRFMKMMRRFQRTGRLIFSRQPRFWFRLKRFNTSFDAQSAIDDHECTVDWSAWVYRP